MSSGWIAPRIAFPLRQVDAQTADVLRVLALRRHRLERPGACSHSPGKQLPAASGRLDRGLGSTRRAGRRRSPGLHRPAGIRDAERARDPAGGDERGADHDRHVEGAHRLRRWRERVAGERAGDDDADDGDADSPATRAIALLIAEAMPASVSSASASTVAVSGATVIESPSEKTSSAGSRSVRYEVVDARQRRNSRIPAAASSGPRAHEQPRPVAVGERAEAAREQRT